MSDDKSPGAPPPIDPLKHLDAILNHLERLTFLNAQAIEQLIIIAENAGVATPEIKQKLGEIVSAHMQYIAFKQSAATPPKPPEEAQDGRTTG